MLLKVVTVLFLACKSDSTPASGRPGEPNPTQTFSIDVAGDPALGPATAKVTIVELSDFECPYCARVGPAIKELQSRYPTIRLVFKQFPLARHPHAQLAAEAALAAHAQGKFWEMHDVLFAHHTELSREAIVGYARQIGLEPNALEAALQAGTARRQIERDIALAAQLGVRGAPALFVNGRYVSAAQPIEAVEARIQAELSR